MFNKIASLRQEKRFLRVFSIICVSKSIAEFCCLSLEAVGSCQVQFVSFLALSQR